MMQNKIITSFNPRICKRCDPTETDTSKSISVSIHASVKDATILNNRRFDLECVSIHASVKDATIGSAYIRARKDVSIHASVKDATIVLLCYREYKRDVSIHASVKDATPI